ncbi:hypothetical protein NMY22_g3438 [Coprinellus aureogranulatus]|nr:hypothetical protein NMY22_g3438 [Coprinellus aureogranulatus]
MIVCSHPPPNIPVETLREIHDCLAIIAERPELQVFRSLSKPLRAVALVEGSALTVVPFSPFTAPTSVQDYIVSASRLSEFLKDVRKGVSIPSPIGDFLSAIETFEIFAIQPQVYQDELVKVLETQRMVKHCIVHAPAIPDPHFIAFLNTVVSATPKLQSLSLNFGDFEYDPEMEYRVHGEYRGYEYWRDDYEWVDSGMIDVGECADTPYCKGECLFCVDSDAVEEANPNHPWSCSDSLFDLAKQLGLLSNLKCLDIFIRKTGFEGGEVQKDNFEDMDLSLFPHLESFTYGRVEADTAGGTTGLTRKVTEWRANGKGGGKKWTCRNIDTSEPS